jgi:hypothetical protein
MPSRLTTTLYDLITALHTVTEWDEDELVVALVTHWMRAGRLTLVDAVSELPACFKEAGIITGVDMLPTTCMVG